MSPLSDRSWRAKYTGMKVGRSHKWYYDKGEWKEKKITPDLWQISYAVTKRRAGRAPEGSGVPVGTEYHWYIVAHQNVSKLNANDYTTSMTGLKFKVAHKRADTDKWSASSAAQRRRLIKFLHGVIDDLEEQEAEEIATTPQAKSPRKRLPRRRESGARPRSASLRESHRVPATGARSPEGNHAYWSPVEISSRPTAPFTIFHRTFTADGGYTCETCGTRRHGTFPRASDLFAVASQHLNLCRGSLRHRPVEGVAILDGLLHGVVLRDGVMILALHSVFGSTPAAVRVFA